MVRTAIQLQTLEELPESLPKPIGRVGKTPLEGVKLFGLDGTPPNAVADALEKADLEVIGDHVPIGRPNATTRKSSTRTRRSGVIA